MKNNVEVLEPKEKLIDNNEPPEKPPEPPNEDDSYEYFDDFDENEEAIKLEYYRESAKLQNLTNKNKIDLYKAQTERLRLYARILTNHLISPVLTSPKMEHLDDEKLGISLNLKSAREMCQIALYNQLRKEVQEQKPELEKEEPYGETD